MKNNEHEDIKNSPELNTKFSKTKQGWRTNQLLKRVGRHNSHYPPVIEHSYGAHGPFTLTIYRFKITIFQSKMLNFPEDKSHDSPLMMLGCFLIPHNFCWWNPTLKPWVVEISYEIPFQWLFGA